MLEAKEATQFYQRWHSIDPTSINQNDLEKYFAQAKAAGQLKNEVRARQSFQILHRVARQTSEKEWHEFAKTGELPPVKLSTEEMELVRGGLLTTGVVVALFMAGYVVGRDLAK